jgi:hypothetical protein
MDELPGPISLEAIKKGVISDPHHQKKDIIEYVEGQLNKSAETEQRVTHLEKIKSEVVFGEEHVAWDVHTDEPGRWWVITAPTNLYSQKEFTSLDYTLSFHVGVTARVASRQAKLAPDERKDRLRATWRRWENAAEALDEGKEPEDFQSIGMMCRETLLELIKSLQNEIPEPSAENKPKAGDFIGWSDLIVVNFASGQRNKHIRSYLKTSAKETWHLVNWLTHTSKASLYEAHLAHDATANLLGIFSLVVVKGEGDGPEACPECKSYRIVSVFEPDLGLEHPYVNLCESCGWNTYDEQA